MRVGIIIPCYNEEKRLNVNAFINFIQSTNKYHLCFVNDGSSDKTIDVLKNMQRQNPYKISVIDIQQNSGKAAAVRTGSKYLYNKGSIDYIGFIDADLSTDFNDFEELSNTLSNNENLNMVFGSRAKEASKNIEKDGIRSVISKIINMLVLFILKLPIQDTQCGAKVYKASLVPIIFKNKFFSRWLFDIEMFLRMKKHFGKKNIMKRILEQPLKRWIHVDDSKLGFKDSIQIPYRLLTIWLQYNILANYNISTATQSEEIVTQIYSLPTNAIA